MITLKQKAYEYIRSRILSNEFKPGALVTELDLSEKLDMSRTPIREALRDLEAEGLVATYPARGTVVAVLTKADVEDIYELRVLLETWALEKGFPYFKEAELAQLETQFIQAFQDYDWERLHHADRALHRLITEKAGSKRVTGFLKTLNSQIERIRRVSAQDAERIDASYHEHLAIIQHIRGRNLDKSVEMLRDHLRSVSNSAMQTAHLMENTSQDEIAL